MRRCEQLQLLVKLGVVVSLQSFDHFSSLRKGIHVYRVWNVWAESIVEQKKAENSIHVSKKKAELESISDTVN